MPNLIKKLNACEVQHPEQLNLTDVSSTKPVKYSTEVLQLFYSCTSNFTCAKPNSWIKVNYVLPTFLNFFLNAIKPCHLQGFIAFTEPCQELNATL